MMSRILVAVSVVISSIGMAFVAARAQSKPVEKLPPPIQLVRATVAKELDSANNSSVKHMFRDYKKSAQGSQTRLYVETKQAMAGMTIAYNDKPLTAQQEQNEEGRLANLINNPQQLERKRRQEKEEADHTLCIVKALPDAFLFEYDGEESGTANLGREGSHLVRLNFRPNPAYHPPSHVEEVLVGMAGNILIDPEADRIARIDGTLFREVTFGWGILGHLNQGGHFLVDQQELDDGSWDISRMSLSFNGKILFFKNISIKSDEVFTDFRRIPSDTSFAQGVEILKTERAKLASGGGETARVQRTAQ